MLINCVAYEAGQKLADISVAEISDHLAQAGRFVWVALSDATEAELSDMQREFGLHELAIEDARHGHQRPKIEEYGATVFAVMHLPEPHADARADWHVGEVNVFVGPNFVLSVRNRSRQGFLGVRSRCEREPHLLQQGAGFLFYALMDSVVDRYFPLIDGLESELEELEARIFSDRAARLNMQHLVELKRRVMVLKHAVAPLMEAVGKLHGGRVPGVCAHSQEYFRDVYDHLVRINASVDTMRDTIATAMQVNLAMVTIEENETTKRLAAWAGLFAVATAFAGIWGMNFKHMPELDWDYGYPAALVFITVVCGFLYWRFRRSGWL